MNKIDFNLKTKDLTMQEVFDKFINIKKILNLSDETIIFYENCFKYFSEFYDKDLPAQNITKDTCYRLY